MYRSQLRKKKKAKRGGASSHYARPNLSTSYQAVNTECEERVARVLQDVLGIETVGLHDNYFELGGNSLLALQVVAELQEEFDVQLSPIAIFECPTVSELGKRLGPARGGQESAALKLFSERRQRVKEHRYHGDIAVIGMAGRFPGADGCGGAWRNLGGGWATR